MTEAQNPETPHIMIVEARFYEPIADELVRGAVAVLEEMGCTYERVAVPGAFEIPTAIRYAIHSMNFSSEGRRFDGYVALGCVIRGQTTHYDYVCQESARGLQELALNYSLALGYGILTVENEVQAWARAKVTEGNIKGGKGGDAARACLAMLELKRRFKLYPR
jgi:6,7-dimethyl-8-ribityllumazine synthase